MPTSPPRPDGRQARWDRHNQERRQRILDAAIAVVESGEPGAEVHVQQIAEQAGLSRTVVYRHFADRSDLDRAVQTAIVDDLYRRFEDFRQAYDDRRLPSEAFDEYAPTRRTLRQFLTACADLSQVVRDVLSAPVAYHLWFVYVLLGLYLLVPLLRPATALAPDDRRRLLVYATTLILGLELVQRLLPILWTGAPRLHGGFLDVVPAGYVGVFLLGFLLFHHPPRVPAVVPAVLAVVGFAWTVLAVWRQQAEPDPDFWAYSNLNLPVLLFAGGVFALLTRPAARYRPSGVAVPVLSALSFRVYLVHALVLHLFRSHGPTGDLYATTPAVGIPVAVVLTLVVSFALAWSMEQVRPLRRVW